MQVAEQLGLPLPHGILHHPELQVRHSILQSSTAKAAQRLGFSVARRPGCKAMVLNLSDDQYVQCSWLDAVVPVVHWRICVQVMSPEVAVVRLLRWASDRKSAIQLALQHAELAGQLLATHNQ